MQAKVALFGVHKLGAAVTSACPAHRSYQAFLETLVDSHERFGPVIHGYCLMERHDHFLPQTPRGDRRVFLI